MTLSEDVLAIEAAMQTILDTILDHHTTTLTAAWATSWASVAGELEAVLLELAEDGDVPGWRIEKSRRAQQGLAAAGRALEDLAELTGTTISDDAARAIGLGVDRSEEHTSELQSRFDLVCRLLLENKKK